MSHGVRHGTHGFTVSGFEIHYGAMPHKRNAPYVLLAFCIGLTLIFGGLIYKAFGASDSPNLPIISKPSSETPHPVPPTSPAVAPIDAPATADAKTLAPVPTNRSEAVQVALNAWIGAHGNHKWGVVVSGLRGDATYASVKPDTQMDLASIYKLLLMYPLVAKLPSSQWGSTYISADGVSKTVANCVEVMIVRSDNPCGHGIGNYVGWTNADNKLATVGLTNTHTASQLSSARQLAHYLELLDGNKLMTTEDKNQLYFYMQRQIYRDGIPAGCKLCIVADKVGFLSAVRNDVGVVGYGQNQAYALVILTNGAPNSEIADLTKRIQAAMESI